MTTPTPAESFADWFAPHLDALEANTTFLTDPVGTNEEDDSE